jgi:hypothetical protein
MYVRFYDVEGNCKFSYSHVQNFAIRKILMSNSNEYDGHNCTHAQTKGQPEARVTIAWNVITNENLVLVVWRKELDKVGKKPRLGII